MVPPKRYRWLKVADVNREYALFELWDGEAQLLDVGFSDDGVLEISLNPGVRGKIIDWTQFLTLLEEGRALAERDR